MSKTQLDTQEMVRLYVNEEWSVRDIATHFGCSYGRIYGLLRARVVLRPSRRTTEYAMVAEVMRQRIVCGDWPHDRKILTNRELARIFDVRHQTVREAVADLRRRGYLRTIPNRGTYVRPPRYWEPSAERSS